LPVIRSQCPKPWFECRTKHALIDIESGATQTREHIAHVDQATLGSEPKYADCAGDPHSEFLCFAPTRGFINQDEIRFDFDCERKRSALSGVEV
jgi:hypothetical protein